ncbi:MAG: RdgB/HAM1 family non-canonical purine NTP pyrophosphatase [Pyrinomonadaceae bacterium]|nr:RdgB/HAM1 family non-canonical purine NTP pyrophosphatase [Pyrinomonadaceae bacterium]
MTFKPRLELLIATHNAGKVRELQQTLRELPLTLRYLAEFPDISTVEETGNTYEANAILKALSYAEQTGICALGDDSGLEVDALGGKPGVLSARFGGENASDQNRTEKLLRVLLPHRKGEITARFICCIAFAGWQSSSTEPRTTKPRILNVSTGTCEGAIALEPRGTKGFGYDPIFIPSGYNETFGELSEDVKGSLSHRAKALSATRGFLTQFLRAT